MPIYCFVQKDFFKTWSNAMSYTLGFLFADGTITHTKRHTSYIAFHTTDRDILVAMASSMRATQKISRRSERSGLVYRLQIGSKDMVADLASLGLSTNKASRMRLPHVPRKYLSDFVRGYFDGDGNIWSGVVHTSRRKKSHTLSAAFTSASREFLSDLLDTLHERGISGGSLYGLKEKNCARLGFGKQDSLKLYEIMYNTGARDMIHLKRKKRVFEAFMQKMRT